MSTGEKIALASLVTGILIPVISIVVAHLYRRQDDRRHMKARVHAANYVPFQGAPPVVGIGVTIICTGKNALEVRDVSLRNSGVDLTAAFLAGFSGSIVPQPVTQPDPDNTGLTVGFVHKGAGGLIQYDEHGPGVRLQRYDEAQFLLPLPLSPLEMQFLLDKALPKYAVSIVANVPPKKDKLIADGIELALTLREILLANRGRVIPPSLTWTYGLFTTASELPDTLPLGRVNDKPITIGRELNSMVPAAPRQKLGWAKLREAFKRFLLEKRFQKLEWRAGYILRPWRCETAPTLHLNVQEYCAVPDANAVQFHPQEQPLGLDDINGLRSEFGQAFGAKANFKIEIASPIDRRPLSIVCTWNNSSCTILFMHEVNGNPAHMHGVLVLLPRISQSDDEAAIANGRNYKCLAGVPDRAFNRTLSIKDPCAAMFFADIGSANYPLLYTIIKLVSYSFPWRTSANESKY